MDNGVILSIESSCDDSAIAITKIADKKLVFHRKISQDEEHSVYGGVVPELASRLHAKALPKLLESVGEYLPQIKAVAVTNEPGLVVSLVEGVSMAKTVGIALGVPLIPVNHLIGHIYSLFIEAEAVMPLDVLLVSGGHTQYMRVQDMQAVEVVAKTMDDSFGESFDKAAKMLGLGYPGGPLIESFAANGDENRYELPVALQDNRAAFSYSGLKNAFRLKIEEAGELDEQKKADLAASFQKVAVAHLIFKIKQIVRENPPKVLGVVGGAAANKKLRAELELLAKKYKFDLLFPKIEFCSDNAAMIGRVGVEAYHKKMFKNYADFDVASRANFN
jgi:N6-L-threonylcarbamoyladenine synthase